jgi:hypothetical protein
MKLWSRLSVCAGQKPAPMRLLRLTYICWNRISVSPPNPGCGPTNDGNTGKPDTA